MNLPHGDFDAGPGYQLAGASCCNCGQLFGFNPYTVLSIPIDPQTGLPPDLDPQTGQPIAGTPDPEAVARSVNQPLCNGCGDRTNALLRAKGLPLLRLPEESTR